MFVSPAANKVYLLYFFKLFVEKKDFYFLLFHHTQTFTHENSHAYVTIFFSGIVMDIHTIIIIVFHVA